MVKTKITYEYPVVFCLALATITACKQRYDPPVLSFNKNYLVVDGVIVPGNDSTVLLLSRTIKISDTLVPQPESGAKVQVFGENNDMHQLVADGAGRYVSPALNLNPNQQYRIDIETTDGHQYRSDFVPIKQSPPIDSLNWDQDTLYNVKLYATTHDDTRSSTYYKWDYTETWEYHSEDDSYYDWINHQEVMRDSTQHVFKCWRTYNSSNINIASTAKLAGDVVYRQPLLLIKNSTEQISFRYSLLAKQYVLTRQAYEFWDGLKKSTEQLGSIFDAQPTQLQSNIHCLNDTSQLVVGFVSISSRQLKRIFIKKPEVLYWNHVPYYTNFNCDTLNLTDPDMDKYFPDNGPHYYTYMGRLIGGGYIAIRDACMDCRVFGGTTVKPSFWP